MNEQPTETKMRVYSVSLHEGASPYTEKDKDTLFAGLSDMLDEMAAGDQSDRISIRVLGMTEAEYAALPEWVGP